tara:strand:+ start:24113 stop:25996 length:1884 start_codon:yes stop_codon:yes gene_type:complete
MASIHFSLSQDPLFQAFNQQKSASERLELVIHKFDQIEKDDLSKWTIIFEDYQSIENQMGNAEEELYYKSLSALIEIKKNNPLEFLSKFKILALDKKFNVKSEALVLSFDFFLGFYDLHIEQILFRSHVNQLNEYTDFKLSNLYSQVGLFVQATKSSLFENQISSRALQLKDSLQSLLTQVRYINELDPDVALIKLNVIDSILNNATFSKIDKDYIKAQWYFHKAKNLALKKNINSALKMADSGLSTIETYKSTEPSKIYNELLLLKAELLFEIGEYIELASIIEQKKEDYSLSEEDQLEWLNLGQKFYLFRNASRALLELEKSASPHKEILKTKQNKVNIVQNKIRLSEDFQELNNLFSVPNSTAITSTEARDNFQTSKQYIKMITLSLLFTLIGFLGLIYAYYRSVKIQKIIELQNVELKNNSEEKDDLLKELHHRVKNNLQMVSSLLSIQMRKSSHNKIIKVLKTSNSRVKSISLANQLYYQRDKLEDLPIQPYFEKLVRNVELIFNPKNEIKINIDLKIDDLSFDIDKTVSLGLVLNELLSNSILHAFSKKGLNNQITVTLIKKDTDVFYFEYIDNGKGWPEDLNEKISSQIGLVLVKRQVNQVGSELSFDLDNQGAKVWFSF